MRLIGRRDFLGSLGLGAGTFLLGNLWKTFTPEARGATPARKRFILISNGNGFVERNYTCTARSETDFDLPAVYEPLAPFKKDLVIAQKFYNPFDRALHGNQWATFSMRPSSNQSGEKRGPPGGISIDRYLAKSIGAKDAFPSTAVGLAEGKNILCLSADGKDQPFPAIGSPVKGYDAYFGAGTGGGADAAKLLAQDKSLLDFITADVGKMNARLAGPEKAKLDQYLTSLREVERQLAELNTARGGCTGAERPAAALDRSSLNPDVIAAHVSVTFAAQLCGLTRVSHVSILGMEAPHTRYGWLGDMEGHHNSHHSSNRPIIDKIDTFILSKVAQMAESLSKVREGDGTMLDNSLVVYINCCGGKHHGGQDMHAVTTVGKAGGAVRAGRYLTFPSKMHSLGDVYTAFAHAMGAPIDKFGDPAHCKGPLPGYLAR